MYVLILKLNKCTVCSTTFSGTSATISFARYRVGWYVLLKSGQPFQVIVLVIYEGQVSLWYRITVQ